MEWFSLHTVVVGLVRKSWVFAIATVMVCAVFAAHAVGAVASARYLEPAPRALPPVIAHSSAATKAAARPDGSGLVARNMFCSDCAPQHDRGDGGGGASDDVPLSGAPAILIATSLGAEPFATVRVLPTDAQGSWGVGERIPGVGVIAEIGPVAIYVLDDATGRRARLSLLDSAAAGHGTGAATPGAGSAAATPSEDAWAGRVRKIDDHTYEVDRDLVRDLVTGATKPGGARVLPMMDKGQVSGFRFSSITAGSLPAALGLKNGDILVAIDGTAIHTAQQMLDVYAKLDQVSGVSLAGTRGGKPLAIDLKLR